MLQAPLRSLLSNRSRCVEFLLKARYRHHLPGAYPFIFNLCKYVSSFTSSEFYLCQIKTPTRLIHPRNTSVIADKALTEADNKSCTQGIHSSRARKADNSVVANPQLETLDITTDAPASKYDFQRALVKISDDYARFGLVNKS